MDCILKGATVCDGKTSEKRDIVIRDGIFVPIEDASPGCPVYDMENMVIFPGFIDVHTHLREPGFEYKETIKTGTAAAAKGGYTHICSMPNLAPVPDCAEAIVKQLDIIKKDAKINVYPYAAITVGEQGEKLVDMTELAEYAVAFSDDGRGVQKKEMMLSAMESAKKLDKIIAAHCEDNNLLFGGYINDGAYAKTHGHRGICSESEWGPIKRDLELVRKTGCDYHICHISAKESVQLVRDAKKEGLRVTCETAPHYLVLDDSMLKEDGRFKMNPPIRTRDDTEALLAGIADGTIDMIATDHAPHSEEEKSQGLEKSLMGITGLETAFPILYTKLVKTGIIGLEKLVELMHTAPMRRFKIGNNIENGATANLTIFDLNEEYTINSKEFLSKGKCTPFDGEKVFGKCKMTICRGDTVWKENLTEN